MKLLSEFVYRVRVWLEEVVRGFQFGVSWFNALSPEA